MKFSLLAPTLLVQVSQLLPMVAFLSLLPNAGFAETAEDRPTIILVPGAFHQPLVYDKVVDLLHNAQYHNVYAIDLPSVGELATRDDDIWSVCAVLFKELEAGRNVLLVGNSYGGTVIGEAVKGLKDDQERVESDEENVGARSFRGKIIALIFLAGYLPTIAEVTDPSSKPDIRTTASSFFHFSPSGEVTCDGDPAHPPSQVFYNDLSAADAQYYNSKLQFSSFVALAANGTYVPYTGGFRCVYVIGKEDKAIPEEWAVVWLEREGVHFEVERIDAGHIMMLRKPGEVCGLIRRVAREKGIERSGRTGMKISKGKMH